MQLHTLIPGLVLDELTSADADAYYSLLHRNREHLSRHGDYQEVKDATPASVAAELATRSGGNLRLGIHLNDQLIGRVDLVAVAPPRYAIGYWLGEDATGNGYATAACAALIEHARTARGATDVFAGVTHGNDRSVAVLDRLGFRPVTRFDTYTRFHLPLGQEPAPTLRSWTPAGRRTPSSGRRTPGRSS